MMGKAIENEFIKNKMKQKKMGKAIVIIIFKLTYVDK